MISNVDYVEIRGSVYTPEKLEGYIDTRRSDYFDRPLIATPIVSESARDIRADKLTETQRYALDTSPYEFNDTIGEKRFKTEFDYYSALMRAIQSNLDSIYLLKRSTAAQLRYVEATYAELYDDMLCTNHDMGRNDKERRAAFRRRYPALVKCRQLLSDFYEEITIEEERLASFNQSASRLITSTESSYAAQGKMWNLRQ